MKNKPNFFEKFDEAYYTSDGYDDYLERFEREGLNSARRLIKKLKPKKTWRFLDVGCGMGGIVSALRKLGYKTWGTEVSKFCLENSPAKKWMRFGNICHLPFKKNYFDVVSTIDALCYLNKKEIKKAIEELARVTKRFLFLETICKGSSNSSQKKNPDSLRKDNYLLNQREIIRLLEKGNFCPLTFLFSPTEKVDFNFLFVKK